MPKYGSRKISFSSISRKATFLGLVGSLSLTLSPLSHGQMLQGLEDHRNLNSEVANQQVVAATNPSAAQSAPMGQTVTTQDTGSLLFEDLTQPAINLNRQEVPARGSNATVLTLAPDERRIARAAWAYIESNTVAPLGLVRAVEGQNTVTLWDVANMIAAVESARTLNLISKADYDQKLRLLIKSLNEAETYFGMSNHLIDVTTGKHPQAGEQPIPRGSQAKDLAYLMVWLEATKRNAPYLANAIDSLVAKWSFCRVRDADGQFVNQITVAGKAITQPVQGSGYVAFTQKALGLWGFQSTTHQISQPKNTQAFGVTFPLANDETHLYADTYLLDGLLFGWDQPDDISSDLLDFTDGWKAELAHRIYQAQYQRYLQTGVLTARASYYGPANQTDGRSNLSYIHQPIISRGTAFQAFGASHIPLPERASLSTKAAFQTWALWDTDYSRLLYEAVADLYDVERGFPEGVFENSDGQIQIYSLDTNANVLVSLAYRHRGVLLPKHNSDAPSVWDKLRKNKNLQHALCLPKLDYGKEAKANASESPLAPFAYRHCDPVIDTDNKVSSVTNCRFFTQ